MSFYQRKLPTETCTAFASKEGKKLFKSSLQTNGLKSFYNVMEQHHTQTEPAFCGVSTLVLVLNALAVDPGQHWKGPWRWYTEQMLNCCLDLEEIKQSGITLRDFQCLALCQGLSVDLTYCDEKNSSLEDFRRAVEAACVEADDKDNDDTDDDTASDEEPLQVLVVSYNRKVLKQTGSGHFSPVAAYDRASDSILILDTARFKYGAHWAMKPIDPDTGKSRGFVLLSFLPHEPKQQQSVTATADAEGRTSLMDSSFTSTQPTSILFRSKMSANEERKKYKEYLEAKGNDNKKGPFETARSYWTKDGHPTAVWNIIEPIRTRDKAEKEMISKMRKLLSDLRPIIGSENDSDDKDNNNSNIPELTQDANCCQNDKHKQCVTVEEALMIICLASISEKERRNLVMNAAKATSSSSSSQNDDDYDGDDTLLVREELLKEASLIASAIAVSDEFESSFQDAPLLTANADDE
ncbi:MAG: hypothetical protein SGARI_002472 [Bacillariaceae sp.]